MLRILTFSTLFPNEQQPYPGIFVEERLRRLVATGELTAIVVAPVPWFPSTNAGFGRYATFARIPRRETRHGLLIEHPRFPVIPKFGMSIAATLMARALFPVVARLHAEHRFDLIDAHYYYPDGVAAAAIARRLGLPLSITARGSDINVISQFPSTRRQILTAIHSAQANITVSQALKDEMVQLGVDPNRITVLRNGVDLERFRLMDPQERDATRAQLGFNRPTLISVGGLIPLKGHDLTIRALRQLPNVDLVIVGEGGERSALETLAKTEGVSERVRFVGRKTHDELVRHYNAADVSVLMSSSEGMANVLLESLACGTPVIATAVGGSPEVIAAPEAGVLLAERSVDTLVNAGGRVIVQPSNRKNVRRYAEQFGWRTTIARQSLLLKQIAAGVAPGASIATR